MSIYFHIDGMIWIYMAYQISLLLVSIINTNKYNFEEKDIPNPRPNMCTSSTFMFVMRNHSYS